MNKTILIGRLTQNPAQYSTKTGTIYCKFTVAVNREYGEEKKADFINCTCFSKQAEHILRYLSKGSLVAVSGRLQTNSYTDNNTHKNVYTTEVITENVQFLDSKKKETSGEIPNQGVTSIKSNEVLNDDDYNQMGFDVNDDEFEYPF